ncbi:MAG: type II and III secretion system protein [Acidobacteria bacterium]|nr:type II and III secretion system protein [Acidobacteriota bacterium]
MLRFFINLHGSLPRTLLCLGLLVAIGTAAPTAYARGEDEYKAGQQAESRQDYDEALAQYQRALQAEPTNVQYMVAVSRTRFQASQMHVERGHRLRAQENLQEALTEYEMAAAIDPSNPVARQEVVRTRALIEAQAAPPSAEEAPQVEEAVGPPQLEPLSRQPIDLRMTNDSKVVFTTIGRLAGINVLFDPDYTAQRVTVELNNVTLEDALDQVSVLTKTFWKPLTRNTILVIPDTAVKRREQEQQVIKSFYLSNTITPQELTEVVTAIRTLLETRRIQQINSMNAIIIRDTPDKVALAEKIIRDVDKAKSEVVVDVAVMEVRRDKTRQLGLAPNIQASASLPATTVGDLSANNISVTLPSIQLNALLSDSHTRILQRPEIRASDGQKATLRIGDRIPIATGSFQPGVGGAVVSPLVQTQFQYTDVGVNLDITPKVHADSEITLKVRVEISAVTQQVDIGGIKQPIIGQRVIEHDIRLREGEINILGGIFQQQKVESVSGIPGLAQIPLLRYLFSNVSDTIAEDEVLIVLQPHVVRRLDITALNRMTLDVGTENVVRLRTAQPSSEETPSGPPGGPSNPAPLPGPGARLRLSTPASLPQAGETFELPLEVENAQGMLSAALEVAYDPRVLRLVRVASGDFLGQGNQPVAVVERIEESSGKTSVSFSRPPNSGGVSGGGTLAVITFQANQPGTTPLKISPANDGSPSSQRLSVESAQTTITVREKSLN